MVNEGVQGRPLEEGHGEKTKRRGKKGNMDEDGGPERGAFVGHQHQQIPARVGSLYSR